MLEPAVPLVILGVHGADELIEARGVVHLAQVAQLMHDHAVDDLGRREHEQDVEVEVLFCGAAPPTGSFAYAG